MRSKGYKVWTVGDDIAWMRIGDDGTTLGDQPGKRLLRRGSRHQREIQPQRAGFTTTKDTIFTNVVHNLDDNTVWWEGLDKNPPKNAVDWKGQPWDGKTCHGSKGAHPNSRFTAPAKNCPCISAEV